MGKQPKAALSQECCFVCGRGRGLRDGRPDAARRYQKSIARRVKPTGDGLLHVKLVTPKKFIELPLDKYRYRYYTRTIDTDTQKPKRRRNMNNKVERIGKTLVGEKEYSDTITILKCSAGDPHGMHA